MLRKPGESDGIPVRRFVLDLNLALDPDITRPKDANIRGCKGAKWRRRLRIYETVASASNSSIERNAKSPVRVLEKDRHLQWCLFDVLSPVDVGGRGPQGLRDHSSSTHDHSVEYPTVLVGKLISDMWRNGGDNERIAFSPSMTRGGHDVALQQTREVSLSSLGTEAYGYIPVDEN